MPSHAQSRSASRCGPTTSISRAPKHGVGRRVAGPDLGERADGRADLQGELVPGVVAAQIGDARAHHQPPVAFARPGVGEREVDDDLTIGGELLEPHEATHVPHQEPGVELVRPEPTADPAGPPVPQGHHDGAQLLPRRGQLVGRPAPVLVASDHPEVLEGPQPFRQQRRRHPGQPPPDLVELGAAAEQLADHQGRPAVAQHLGTARDGAELAVVDHLAHLRNAAAPRLVQTVD